MADALSAFLAIAPPGVPRLFVIGCMEELGREAAAEHRALGRLLRLEEEDRLLVIGTHAADVCTGVLDLGNFSRQLQIVSSLDPMAAAIAEWRGAIFVKGSRRYQLERAVPGPREQVHA
jgi:UDP-N-acetylmuramyl pentapeptide synthase